MKGYNFFTQSAYSFLPFRKDEVSPFLQMFPDTHLLKSMQRAAEEEQFEMALVYQNELSRRRKA